MKKLTVSAYRSSTRLPVQSTKDYLIDIRRSSLGPDLVQNADFSRQSEGWTMYIMSEEDGTIGAESEMLKARVDAMNPSWPLLAFQTIGTLKAGVDYRLSFRARSEGAPGSITVKIQSYTTKGVSMEVDGRVKDEHGMDLSVAMTPYTVDFRVHGERDIDAAILSLGFDQVGESIVDDLSLRSREM